MLRLTLGMLAVALSCLGVGCDDGTDLYEAPLALARQAPPQQMSCGRVVIRNSVPGSCLSGRLQLLEHTRFERPDTGSFLRSAAALAGTFGEGTCRLQLTQFADGK
jgi:hypothetical protein